jgi:choline kinase
MGYATRNIITLRNKKEKLEPLTVIIPAAGEGIRMKSYGPKPLIKIHNISILENQIKLIRSQFDNSTIILISGYESQKIINNSPKQIVHIENEKYQTTNVVKSISIGLKATITNRVLLIYGDLVFNKDTLKYPLYDNSLLFIDNSGTMTDEEVGCIINDKIVENIMYDLPNKWAQIAYFTGKELDLLKILANNPNNEKLLGFEIINEIINLGGKFMAAIPKNIKVNDIDSSKDILIAETII